MTAATGTQWRVEFDAEVEFSNGGALQAQEFRLDIPGTDIDDAELGELFVRHLGLLMVGTTRITRKVLIQEPHKGSRGVRVAAGPRRTVELTGAGGAAPALSAGSLPDLPTLVDLPATVVRTLGSDSAEVDRATLVPFEVAGTVLVLHTDDRSQLTEAAAAWLVEQGVALVATDAADIGVAGRTLLGADVPVIAGLTGLDRLPPGGFRLHAVPLTGGRGPWPARVYAVVDGG